MATIEDAIYARLDSQLTCDVAPGKADENSAMPYVVYKRTDGDAYSAMSEDVIDASATFRISCYANTYTGTKTLAASVRAALKRYAGTSATVVINDILLTSEHDGDDEEDRMSVVQIYEVKYDEP